MRTCKKCNGGLSWWSNFRDMAMKENIAYASVMSLFNGIDHMVFGNSKLRTDGDYISETLFYCKRCKTYYIPCPKCRELIPLNSMPKNGQTMVECSNCGTKTIYAGDYEMGGG